jgi:outer membrane protein assembly factor BamB
MTSHCPYPPAENPAHSEYVTAAVPIIDLDAAPARADAAPAPPRLRPALILGVLALSLATLAFAGAPPRQLSQVLAAGGQPAAAFVLGPGTLYTAHYGNNPNSESALRRWNLRDGSLSWATALPQNVANVKVDAAAHVLMASSGNEPRVTFLDTESGEPLWQLEGTGTTVAGLAAGRVLIRTDPGTATSVLRLADARTGHSIWSHTVDALAAIAPATIRGAAPDRIAAIAVSGEVTVLRWTDGAVLAEGDLHVRLPLQADYNRTVSDFLGVSAVGDRVYVSRRDNGRSTLTAFAILPMRPLWQVAGGPAGFVSDCAVVLCVADTRFVSGVDPATGAVRWTAPGVGSAVRFDDRHLLGYDQQENPTASVLDARTGRAVQRLGQTYAVGDLLLRSDLIVPGRTWVSVAGGAGEAPRTVGSVAVGAPYGCVALDRYLACPTVNGPTVVWRVPPLS